MIVKTSYMKISMCTKDECLHQSVGQRHQFKIERKYSISKAGKYMKPQLSQKVTLKTLQNKHQKNFNLHQQFVPL